MQKKKKSLGGGISEKFCSNGGTMTRQILVYSRYVKFWSDIPRVDTSLSGIALTPYGENFYYLTYGEKI